MRRLEQIVREIHRRSLWQVLAVYAAGSWVALEVVGELTEALSLPDWVPPLAIALLVLELPVVVATAFVQEGIRGSREDAGGARMGAGDGAEGPAEDAAARAPSPPDAVDRASAAAVAAGSARRSSGARDGGAERVGADGPDGGARGILTWRNALRTAVAALALFGLATAGWAVSRALGIGPAATLVSRGVIEEREPVVLAEFGNATPDSLLGETVAEAVRIDLLQSPTLSVMDRPWIEEVLRRMGRDPSTTLDPALAREVAVREGLEAVITGGVRAAGTGYVLSAELVSAEDGRSLVAVGETAESGEGEDLIAAIARLSRSLRERVGEPLRTLRDSEPLARVSTGSLEALRRYTAALRAANKEGDWVRAADLLEEAVVLDSTFAMAYRKLGVAPRVPQSRRVEALVQAYRLRDRLVDRERLLVEGTYHSAVSGDRGAAVAAYRSLLAAYPEDATARHNLAEMLYRSGDFEGAIVEVRRAIEVGPTLTSYTNLPIYLWDAGHPEEAMAAMEELVARFPENMIARIWPLGGPTALRDYEEADSMAAALAEELTSVNARIGIGRFQAWIDAVRGRLEEADAHLSEFLGLVTSLGMWGTAYGDAIHMAELSLWSRGDPERAVRDVERLLSRHPLEERDVLDRPYLALARFYARAGRLERAEASLREYEARVPSELRGDDRPVLTRIRGLLALERGRIEEAISAFREADADHRSACLLCSASDLGIAFDRAGEADSAIAYYERYLDTPWSQRIFEDPLRLPWTLERLARLLDERGDTEEAAARYAEFVSLWEQADPELQPRVEAARKRLEEILAERG